jgi:ABC-type glutathione transport system ATPase component
LLVQRNRGGISWYCLINSRSAAKLTTRAAAPIGIAVLGRVIERWHMFCVTEDGTSERAGEGRTSFLECALGNSIKLEIQSVSMAFATETGSVEALSPVSFALSEGSFVSVIGPSGCGKSTLFNVIAGLQRPSSGVVAIDGEDATGTIGRVGYMLQKDLLLPWRSVLDNVVLGMEIKGVSRTRARATALPYLQR